MRRIHVTGTGTSNKGAELLLIAIQQQIAAVLPQAQLAVTPNFGTYDDRARHGLRTVLPEVPRGRWWLAGKLMPAGFRHLHGIVTETEIDAVLDASGFAFGDQLGAPRVQKFAHDVKRWKTLGSRVVLMPQALGPFEVPAVRAAFQKVADYADLIFAREGTSFRYASQLGISESKLRQAPDFTNLLDCPDCDGRMSHHRSLVVPNFQMIARTGTEQQQHYVPFLARCYRQLKHAGLEPAILLHDDRVDSQLIEPLRQELTESFPVLGSSDPIELKGMLGCAKLVIGSRFHALVGALSQAVPSIAAGWSHKYVTLLADYDCSDCLLSVNADERQISELVGRIMDEWDVRHQRTQAAGEILRHQTREMWHTVFQAIGCDVKQTAH